MLDRVIRGGLVVDGTGAPARVADVGIRGGRIAAVGRRDRTRRRDCRRNGKVVCPGFIDLHTHYDAQTPLGPHRQSVGRSRCHHGGGWELRFLHRTARTRATPSTSSA